MTCKSIISTFHSFLNAAEFLKTPSPKPARIPPQTPPAGGKSAEAGRILPPRHIVSPCRVRISSFNHLDFARNSFELCPKNTAMDQQTIEELGRHHKVFDPPPHGNTFVIEPTQPIIFETWKRQLEDYRGRLAVVA